jgi:hypothetical protein
VRQDEAIELEKIRGFLRGRTRFERVAFVFMGILRIGRELGISSGTLQGLRALSKHAQACEEVRDQR